MYSSVNLDWDLVSAFLNEREKRDSEQKRKKELDEEWLIIKHPFPGPILERLCEFAFKGNTQALKNTLKSITFTLCPQIFSECCEFACLGDSLETCTFLVEFSVEHSVNFPWRNALINSCLKGNHTILKYLLDQLSKEESFCKYFDREDFNHAVSQAISSNHFSLLNVLIKEVSFLFSSPRCSTSIEACESLWLDVLVPRREWPFKPELEELLYADKIQIFKLLFTHKFPSINYQVLQMHTQRIRPKILAFCLQTFANEEEENNFFVTRKCYDHAITHRDDKNLFVIHQVNPPFRKLYFASHTQSFFESLLLSACKEFDHHWFHFLCEHVLQGYLFSSNIMETNVNHSAILEIYKPCTDSKVDAFTYCRYILTEYAQCELLEKFRQDSFYSERFPIRSKSFNFLLLYGIVEFQSLSNWLTIGPRMNFTAEMYKYFYRFYKQEKWYMKQSLETLDFIPLPILHLVWEYLGGAIGEKVPNHFGKMDLYEKLERAYWNIFRVHYSKSQNLWNMFEVHHKSPSFAQAREEDLRLHLI